MGALAGRVGSRRARGTPRNALSSCADGWGQRLLSEGDDGGRVSEPGGERGVEGVWGLRWGRAFPLSPLSDVFPAFASPLPSAVFPVPHGAGAALWAQTLRSNTQKRKGHLASQPVQHRALRILTLARPAPAGGRGAALADRTAFPSSAGPGRLPEWRRPPAGGLEGCAALCVVKPLRGRGVVGHCRILSCWVEG